MPVRPCPAARRGDRSMSTPIRRAYCGSIACSASMKAQMPAAALRLGDDVVHEGRLAGSLRTEDLDDASAREPTDAERHVERERAGRHRSDRDLRTIAHPHHRALPELPLDLAQCDVERFLAFHRLILLSARSDEHDLTTRSNEHDLANTTPVPRTAPPTGAGVKAKQRRRTERMSRSPATADRASDARGTAEP